MPASLEHPIGRDISIPHRQATDSKRRWSGKGGERISIPHRQATDSYRFPVFPLLLVLFQSLIGRLQTRFGFGYRFGFLLFQSLIGRLQTFALILAPFLFCFISIPHRQATDSDQSLVLISSPLFQSLIGRLQTWWSRWSWRWLWLISIPHRQATDWSGKGTYALTTSLYFNPSQVGYRRSCGHPATIMSIISIPHRQATDCVHNRHANSG